MKSVVVVPCHSRPDFLAATLIRLFRARRSHEALYLFAIDRGFDERVPEVIKAIVPDNVEYRTAKRNHSYAGTHYNIMEAYRDATVAIRPKPDLIYIVEDDVLVSEDFFEFHEDAHELDEEAFCVSACRNQNLGRKFDKSDAFFGVDNTLGDQLAESGDLSFIYRHISYQSIGVSHKTDMMLKVIEHACKAYYEHPVDYCIRVLSDPDLPDGAASQDGLIHRVVRRNLWWSIYPFVPRAYHAGWIGFNRRSGQGLALPWRQAADRILEMSELEMNELADPDFVDIKQCELDRASPAELKIVTLDQSRPRRDDESQA